MQFQRLTKFVRALSVEWRRLALPLIDARVVIAVSGGADSTALLLACEELRRAKKLSIDFIIAHLNHNLRGAQADEDASWVAELAKRFGFETMLECVDVKKQARASHDNLEQAARRARYDFLRRVAGEQNARIVLTAHTLDDQAETFLLRLMRGSGAEGLSGMRTVARIPSPKSQVPSEKLSSGLGLETGDLELFLVRPLLGWARREMTESYCRERGVEFRVDGMNADVRFARVRVRREVLPLLEKLNPRAIETLARTAGILREDDEALNAAAEALLKKSQVSSLKLPINSDSKSRIHALEANVQRPKTENYNSMSNTNLGLGTWDLGLNAVRVDVLRDASAAVRMRALRLWLADGRGDLRRIGRVHLRAVEKLLEGERGGRVAELPGGCRIERRCKLLIFHANKS